MKVKVEAICPQTEKDFIKEQISGWENITDEINHSLINSMKDQLQKVIANNGGGNGDELK